MSEFVGCSAGPATDSGLRELELRLLDELEVRLVLELRLLLRVALLNDDCRVIGVGNGGFPICVYTLRSPLESLIACATDRGYRVVAARVRFWVYAAN